MHLPLPGLPLPGRPLPGLRLAGIGRRIPRHDRRQQRAAAQCGQTGKRKQRSNCFHPWHFAKLPTNMPPRHKRAGARTSARSS